jgi:hypothetical protein
MSTIALGHHNSRNSTARPVRHLRAVPDSRPAVHIRLTRRGKVVILAAAVAVIATLVVLFGSSSIAGDQAGVAPETTTVHVTAGHTLWDIATDANPNGDIRKTVDEIVRLNSLPNASALQLGSDIAVPVYK